jgi:GNAT superfamily N-acetyltransferase
VITRYPTPSAFLAAAGPFLTEREAEHNLFFGIGSNLVLDEERGVAPAHPFYLATIEREGSIKGAMLMTPPRQLVVSCLGPVGASGTDAALVDDLIAEIAEDVGRYDPPTPGVLAPVPIARAFARAWCAPRDLIARRSVAERIYRLEQLRPPVGVAGTVRLAGRDDRDLLVRWMRAFMREAFGRPDDQEALVVVDRALDLGQRRFYLWEEDGRVVSTAALGGPTPNGLRIGPVYTPPEERGHGYGSAVTAAATQVALEEGRRFVFLLTDLANPTSNKIYQAIGYEAVIDVDLVRFERP